MRRIPLLLALLLAASARAQVVPISGRVSAPVSGANAGAYRTPDAGLALSPGAGAFLPPALTASFLGAPAIVSREAASVEAKTNAVTPAVRTPIGASPVTVTPSLFTAPAGVAVDAALSAASKDAGREPGSEQLDSQPRPGSDPKNVEPWSDPGKLEDGRALFDGAGQRPDDPGGPNEPTQAELDAAFGSRKPFKTFLSKFGIAGALLAVNSIAYSAVPNDGTETGTLAHLSFDSQQFLTAFHNFSVSGLAESAWRAMTSMFMHANNEHIFGNMMMMLLFAPWVQSALGGRRTMVIYLAGGLAATISWAFIGSTGLILGASAAISALMGAVLTVWTKPKDGEDFDLMRACFQAFAAVMIGMEVKSLILQGPVTPEHVVTLAHVVGAGAGLMIGGWYALRRRAKERAAP